MGNDGSNDVGRRGLGPDRSCDWLIRYDNPWDYNAEQHRNNRRDVYDEHDDDNRGQWIDDRHDGAPALGGAGASYQ